MKRFTFLYLLIFPLSVFSLKGQEVLNQGNFVLGATLGFSSADSKVTFNTSDVEEKGDGPSALQFNFAPNVGYFIADNFAVGMGLDYTFSSLKEPDESRTDDSDLLFGPFTRYYLPIADDMAFFFEADFGFGSSSDEQFIGNNATRSIKTDVFALGFGPGFTIFSNSDVGIEALIKYNYARSKFDAVDGGVNSTTTTKTNQIDFAIGVQFYFGGLTRASNQSDKPSSVPRY